MNSSRSVLSMIRVWGNVVAFPHTVFALPFALSAYVIAIRSYPTSLGQFGWIVLCLVAARTAAMGWNRWLDADIDSENPRTRGRDIPAGRISRGAVLSLTMGSGALFVWAAFRLSFMCGILSPFVLAILLLYSWTKRYTRWSHLVLGLCLALAPGGVWVAVTGAVAWEPVALMVGVLLWVAGFDILYSCQDCAFDRSHGLLSVPAQVGIPRALWISRLLHLSAVLAFLIFGWTVGLGLIYGVGVILFALFLVDQHRLVSPQDFTRINAAFFTRNGIASIVLFVATLCDVWLSH